MCFWPICRIFLSVMGRGWPFGSALKATVKNHWPQCRIPIIYLLYIKTCCAPAHSNNLLLYCWGCALPWCYSRKTWSPHFNPIQMAIKKCKSVRLGVMYDSQETHSKQGGLPVRAPSLPHSYCLPGSHVCLPADRNTQKQCRKQVEALTFDWKLAWNSIFW
jgi:hypothetical protein